jgi:hypothetical protein
MQETMLILDRLLAVKIDATLWGGRKKLRKEDLILADGSVLPPEDLASLGSKRIADPAELAVFHRLKKEAERICLRVGTRFLGGFAVPEAAIGSIRWELDRIALSFRAARDDFLSRYDQTVEDWVAKHPEFAPAIRRAVDPVDVVAASLRFDYVIFRVTRPVPDPEPDERENAPMIGDSLDRKVGSLSETLFREIAQEADELVENSLLGRQAVTRKALNPFKRIRDKLDGLAFLDHRVHPVVETLDDLLARVPKAGLLEGAYLQEVLATALLLSDSERIKRHGDGLLHVHELIPPMAGEAQLQPEDEAWPSVNAPGPTETGLVPDESSADEGEEETATADDFWF